MRRVLLAPRSSLLASTTPGSPSRTWRSRQAADALR
jgi:hypothetical protein